MRALWSDRPNCSHNVSQKVKRIKRFSDQTPIFAALQVPKGLSRTDFSTESDSVVFCYSVVNSLRIVIHYSKYSESVNEK